MIIYRIMVKTSQRGGMLMDGTSSLALAINEAQAMQAENPHFALTVEAEEWPTLTPFKYRWYQLTGRSEGFGVEFQRRFGHKHASTKLVWPHARAM